MAMTRSARAAGITLLLMVAFCGWYAIASNYDYGALSGTYRFKGNGESSILMLKSDRTFHQELKHDGKLNQTDGTWRRIGEGRVTFSGNFLRLPGQQSYADKFGNESSSATDTDFGGEFKKILTVYPELHLDAVPNDIVLHKELFH
jgi:hypothetical protein